MPVSASFLHHLDIALKIGIVDKVAVGLTVLIDEHIKGLHQLTPLPSRGLLYGVDAVGHVLGLGEAVLIAGEDVTLGFLGSFITACGFEVDFKYGSRFGRFNLGLAVVGVLNDGDVPFDDLLVYIILCGIVFHGVKLGFCTYMVDCTVQKIALGRGNLTDAPVIAADIILGGELPVFIGGVSVNQFLALIDAVDRTCKGSVPLRLSRLHVRLCHGDVELLQHVHEAAACDLFPFNRGGLGRRHDISGGGVHFLQYIGHIAADKHVLIPCHAVCVGDGILIHGQTA